MKLHGKDVLHILEHDCKKKMKEIQKQYKKSNKKAQTKAKVNASSPRPNHSLLIHNTTCYIKTPTRHQKAKKEAKVNAIGDGAKCSDTCGRTPATPTPTAAAAAAAAAMTRRRRKRRRNRRRRIRRIRRRRRRRRARRMRKRGRRRVAMPMLAPSACAYTSLLSLAFTRRRLTHFRSIL
jgi:hypothetical protein